MYRTASRSRASQRAAERSSDRGPKRAHYVVIAFRVGVDNQGRRRIYRRVWPESFVDLAVRRLLALPTSYAYACAVGADGVPASHTGDPRVAEEWAATRRGVNRGVDWSSAATYAHREMRGRGAERTAIAEHNDRVTTIEQMREGGWRVPR